MTTPEIKREKRSRRRRTSAGETASSADADQRLRAELVRYLWRAVIPLMRRRDPEGFIRWGRQMLTLVLLADVDPMTLVVQEATLEDREFKARLKELYLEQREWEQARPHGAGQREHEDEFTVVAREYLLRRLEQDEKGRSWLPILAAALAPGGALSQVVEVLAASRGLDLSPDVPTSGADHAGLNTPSLSQRRDPASS